MTLPFSRTREDVVDDLERQVSAMKREISSLRRSAAERGSRAYDEVTSRGSHAYDDVAEIVADLLGQLSRRSRPGRREVKRQARIAGAAVRDNPKTTALVGLAALGLAAALLMRR
ncbi:hypothetical protein [Aquibium oceanicum]|uniref:DUF883 domain-containing protein n=1 Tax=Aquibium oceanicum TaxID=1670800 RepID=A0A1L3SNN2_9HYPH|nr:hypothetical protein [Aquibium oceanicum]APH71014.1 hypothetical protein BSQ44_06215 [Aquibium oceanicum]